MNWVLDASAVMKWLVSEDHSDIADRVLTGSDELHAPFLMVSEHYQHDFTLGTVGRDRTRSRHHFDGIYKDNLTNFVLPTPTDCPSIPFAPSAVFS